jgi:hypothetical protein
MSNPVSHACALCGAGFVPARGNQRFCSADCRIAEQRRRGRLAMRAKRGSFAPHPCLGCGTPVVGRAKRCPACKRADVLARQRADKANPAKKAKINAQRRARRASNPELRRAAEARKRAAIAADPARAERARKLARERSRRYAAAKRLARETITLLNLTQPK